MTFLQYVCERLLGPPAKPGGSYGESYWCCPFHGDGNPSFHTMPHKPEHKDRWLCFGCGMRGDEADLMKERMPGENWPQRRARLLHWQQEFEREVKTPPKPVSVIHPIRGAGSKRENPYDRSPKEDEFSDEVNAAISELLTFVASCGIGLPVAMALCEKALSLCAAHALHPQGLAGRCGAVRWFHETDAEHMAVCNNTDCDWRCCRLARGWTDEEIKADIAKSLGRPSAG
jgi:CHC2 zinc finger